MPSFPVGSLRDLTDKCRGNLSNSAHIFPSPPGRLFNSERFPL
jgi:hypothetical protein